MAYIQEFIHPNGLVTRPAKSTLSSLSEDFATARIGQTGYVAIASWRAGTATTASFRIRHADLRPKFRLGQTEVDGWWDATSAVHQGADGVVKATVDDMCHSDLLSEHNSRGGSASRFGNEPDAAGEIS